MKTALVASAAGAALGGLAGALLEYYLRACEQSGQPPDAAVLTL